MTQRRKVADVLRARLADAAKELLAYRHPPRTNGNGVAVTMPPRSGKVMTLLNALSANDGANNQT